MGKAIRRNCASRHLLQMIVSNRRGGTKTISHVGLVDLAALGRSVSPDTCQTVSLELQHDGELIPRLRIARLKLTHAILDAEDVLDVVAQLMSDHIRLSKVSRASADAVKLIPETEIDIDLLVGRAIERPCL
jgi:hypothetical protein